jgi:outer membrane protein TolC
MRLTTPCNRRLRVAIAMACLVPSGCQRIPYIDQKKPVTHDPVASIEREDSEVRQAAFFSDLPTQLPQIDRPRTPDNPEALEPWPMTLQEAIQIGMDNSEVIRVISLGAQGIPVSGFEPTPLNTGAGGALGQGTLSTVYDPAIQETQIANALAAFDAQFSTQLFYERRANLVNNVIQAGSLDTNTRVPALTRQAGAPAGQPSFEARLSKRNATGGTMAVVSQVDYNYANSPFQTFPSAYNTRTFMQLSQPLLGGNQQNGPSGLEANRAPIVIARLNADVSVWRFKAEVMAMVRSIEQQYWALAQQQVQYWSRQQAVLLGEAILEREQIKRDVGTGSEPNVAEADQNLRQFQLELVQATTDLLNVERQLRNILGLPPADNRRIVPVTAPTEARLEPEWDTSLAQMLSYQPDIVQQQLLLRVAELQLLVARNQLLPALSMNVLYQLNGFGKNLDDAVAVMTGRSILAIDPVISAQQQAAGINASPSYYKNFTNWQIGFTFSMPIGFRAELANSRQVQYALLRQRAFLQQTVHQSMHALARFFNEVDSQYKLLKYAGLAREAAEKRLAAQRAFFETGTINIDRYLDAVNRWANAVALEAQYKTSYNTSIAALEEAKGTLLAYDNIAVAEGPNPRKAYIQAMDQRDAHKRFSVPLDGSVAPRPVVAPLVADPVPPRAGPGHELPELSPIYPAPAGSLGPDPQRSAPSIPAGDPSPLSQRSPSTTDPGVERASSAPKTPIVLPPLPPMTDVPNGASTPPIELPPLPPM